MTGFTTSQIDALSAPLDRSNVATRKQSGRDVSYIEGWHAEAEANRIFGFDKWDTEEIWSRCVSERERKIGQSGRDGWSVSYVCKVRVTVRAGSETVVREGVGAGHGIDADVGLAHESAIKEAATDAEKRALKTFGNPFGLALYDKTQANVAVAPGAKDMAVKLLNACKTLDELKDAWTKNAAGWRGIMEPQDFAAVERAKESVKLALSTTAQDPFSEAA